MYIVWRAATVRPMMCELLGGLAVDSLLRSVGAVPELCRALRQVTTPVYRTEREHTCRVADPDPQNRYVFGPPGSGSFFRQAKIVRKTLISTVL